MKNKINKNQVSASGEPNVSAHPPAVAGGNLETPVETFPATAGCGAATCSAGGILESIMFGDLGNSPDYVCEENEENRKEGIKSLNKIVDILDAVTQNKSLEWKLRMASARISTYLESVMDSSDHCGLVPLYP